MRPGDLGERERTHRIALQTLSHLPPPGPSQIIETLSRSSVQTKCHSECRKVSFILFITPPLHLIHNSVRRTAFAFVLQKVFN